MRVTFAKNKPNQRKRILMYGHLNARLSNYAEFYVAVKFACTGKCDIMLMFEGNRVSMCETGTGGGLAVMYSQGLAGSYRTGGGTDCVRVVLPTHAVQSIFGRDLDRGTQVGMRISYAQPKPGMSDLGIIKTNMRNAKRTRVFTQRFVRMALCGDRSPAIELPAGSFSHAAHFSASELVRAARVLGRLFPAVQVDWSCGVALRGVGSQNACTVRYKIDDEPACLMPQFTHADMRSTLGDADSYVNHGVDRFVTSLPKDAHESERVDPLSCTSTYLTAGLVAASGDDELRAVFPSTWVAKADNGLLWLIHGNAGCGSEISVALAPIIDDGCLHNADTLEVSV